MDHNVASESSQLNAGEPTSHDHRPLPLATLTEGHYIHLEDGRKVLDACGGAAVACIGHRRFEVIEAMTEQAERCSYVPWAFFENHSTKELCDFLVDSTGGRMTKVYLTSSGMSLRSCGGVQAPVF